MNELLEALLYLANRFHDHGSRDGKWIAICLLTIHGSYMAGTGTLLRIKNLCVQFAAENLGAMDN
jgi:hypothetical protein